jgi:hypothetical protein
MRADPNQDERPGLVTGAGPVFVVGVPRSGTTLLTAILGSHSAFDCGPESGFFVHLARGRFEQALRSRRWPDAAVRALDALPHPSGRTLVDRYDVRREAVRAFLEAHERSPANLLRSITEVSAAHRGRRRWVEKTPLHLLHVEDVLAHFPNARIVRIVRDPRDAASSMCRLPFESDSFVANCYAWMHYHAASRDTLTTDERCTTIRFEDLLHDVEPTVRSLCTFVGEHYEPAMIDHAARSSRVRADGEPWKNRVSERLDGSMAFRWRQGLDADSARVASLICHEALAELGYETMAAPQASQRMEPLDTAFIERNEDLIRRLAARGRRIAPATFHEPSRIDAIGFGRDAAIGSIPLSIGTMPRLGRCIHLAARLVTSRLRGAPARYLVGTDWGPGRADRLAGALVRSLGRPIVV